MMKTLWRGLIEW